jgi:hypothetical protein
MRLDIIYIHVPTILVWRGLNRGGKPQCCAFQLVGFYIKQRNHQRLDIRTDQIDRTGFVEALVDDWMEQRPAVLERYIGWEVFEELRLREG